jgi:hypothetical protein
MRMPYKPIAGSVALALTVNASEAPGIEYLHADPPPQPPYNLPASDVLRIATTTGSSNIDPHDLHRYLREAP